MTIIQSTFIDNYSTGRGSIIFAEELNAVSTISDSSFLFNYALLGGVFFSQQNGLIICLRCTLTGNFALYGGVIYSQNEGQAYFTDSIITANNAL